MMMLDPIAATLPGPTHALRTQRDSEHHRDPHAGERRASGHQPPHEEHAAPSDDEPKTVGSLLDVKA